MNAFRCDRCKGFFLGYGFHISQMDCITIRDSKPGVADLVASYVKLDLCAHCKDRFLKIITIFMTLIND